MIRGITFDKQLLKSEDFAHQTNYFYQGKMGVTKGCEISVDANGDLVVADGYFIVFGRQVANIGNTVIDVPTVASGTLYSRLVFTIDLTLENTVDTFNQGKFEIISNSVAYPTLIQEDLDNGGTKYQLEFYKFNNTTTGITNGTDTRTLLDLSMYALGEDLGNVDNLKTTEKTAVGAINQLNDNLAYQGMKMLENDYITVGYEVKSGWVLITVSGNTKQIMGTDTFTIGTVPQGLRPSATKQNFVGVGFTQHRLMINTVGTVSISTQTKIAQGATIVGTLAYPTVD